MDRLAEMMIDGAMDFDPAYKVYRDLFPDNVIPPKERKFLKFMYPIDMSRRARQQVKFHPPTFQQLKTLLRDECIGTTVISDETKRREAKALLAMALGVVNMNNTPYTAADDKAGDPAIRIGIDRDDGIFGIRLGTDKSNAPISCAICVLEGPMEGFFYFDPKKMGV
jgi:hypothetical protein